MGIVYWLDVYLVENEPGFVRGCNSLVCEERKLKIDVGERKGNLALEVDLSH